jgi:hypothetical protein
LITISSHAIRRKTVFVSPTSGMVL